MEKLIIVKSEIIQEEKYKKIKKQMNKKDNWFSEKEVKILKKMLKKLT